MCLSSSFEPDDVQFGPRLVCPVPHESVRAVERSTIRQRHVLHNRCRKFECCGNLAERET